MTLNTSKKSEPLFPRSVFTLKNTGVLISVCNVSNQRLGERLYDYLQWKQPQSPTIPAWKTGHIYSQTFKVPQFDQSDAPTSLVRFHTKN